MEKTIYLHIGGHKTGTSAIQLFLSINRNLLKKNDILYPGRNTACYDMSTELTTKPLPEIISDAASPSKKYVSEIQKASCTNTILSSEDFIKLKKEEMLALKKIFPEEYRVKIIVYLRRQDDKIESHYNQIVRQPNVRHQQKFSESMQTILKSGHFDYHALLLPWSEVFGKENIIVKCYEKEQLPNGIYQDFFEGIGLGLDSTYQIPEDHVNKSLNWDLIEIIRVCNNRIGNNPRFHRFLVNNLTEINLKYTVKQQRLLSPLQRREILKNFEESNASVAREYLGRPDGRLFYAPLPDPDESWTPYQGLTVEKFVPILTQMIVNLDREQQKKRDAIENRSLKGKIFLTLKKTGARFGLLPAMEYWYHRLRVS